MITCPDCQGSGWVYLEYRPEYEESDSLGGDRRLLCASCNGTGKVPEDWQPDRSVSRKQGLLKGFLEAFLEIFVRPH